VQEVIAPQAQKSLGLRIASGVGFWTLALAGTGLFALAILATPVRERQEMNRKVAVEQAKVDQLEDLNGSYGVQRDALRDDPKYIARQMREDMGFRREGDEPLPIAMRAGGAHLKPLAVKALPETRLDLLCRVFAQPLVRGMSLVGSLLALALAFLFFDIPTVSKKNTPSPAPPPTVA
jgi:hypothetical protein